MRALGKYSESTSKALLGSRAMLHVALFQGFKLSTSGALHRLAVKVTDRYGCGTVNCSLLIKLPVGFLSGQLDKWRQS